MRRVVITVLAPTAAVAIVGAVVASGSTALHARAYVAAQRRSLIAVNNTYIAEGVATPQSDVCLEQHPLSAVIT